MYFGKHQLVLSININCGCRNFLHALEETTHDICLLTCKPKILTSLTILTSQVRPPTDGTK